MFYTPRPSANASGEIIFVVVVWRIGALGWG